MAKDEDHPNKPQDTAFKQQRLAAWQPILTPKVIIASFLLVGVVFVIIGWVLDTASQDVVEYRLRYDGLGGTPEQAHGNVYKLNDAEDGFEASFDDCRIDDDFSFDRAIGAGTQKSGCFLEFDITETMDGTVYVYYELDNFYQNHRRYVSSRVDTQLRGEEPLDYSLCDPLETRSDLGPAADGEVDEGSKRLNPCGLIAYSLFNDTIGPPVKTRDGTVSDVSFTYDNIAWESDVESKFNNFDSLEPPTCTSESEAALPSGSPPTCYEYPDPDNEFYLYQAYPFSINEKPHCSCPSNPVTEACLAANGNRGEGCCALRNEDLETQYWDCGCEGCPFPGKDTFGVTDEHFIVWMRTAGLPKFRKLYMKIDAGELQVGDKLRLPLKTAFPVGAFSGKKSIVISTVSSYGGKNDFLGIAYIVVGALCLFFGVGFLIKDFMNPRKLGDPEALNWKKTA